MQERDQEIEDFILSRPPSMTWSEVTRAVLDRFGEARAWSRERIIEFWNVARETRRGQPGKLERDQEVAAFVNDRLGRMGCADIADACRERFGDRAPSKSAINRHHQKLRGIEPSRRKERSVAKLRRKGAR